MRRGERGPMGKAARPLTARERIEAVRKILRLLYRIASRDPELVENGRMQRAVLYYLFERPERDKFAADRPHSKAARRLRKRGGPAWRAGRRYDHAIPLMALKRRLQRGCDAYADMRDVLHKYVHGVVITKPENDRLNKLRLKDKMPAGAWSPRARYQAAGIEFSKEDLALFRRG
jgi:hypothetical protein